MYSVVVSSTVVAAIAALAGVLLGQVLARSGEYRRWLRAERHKASAELLAAAEALHRRSAERLLDTHYDDPPPDDAPYLADMERLGLALEALRTVFPGRVEPLAQEFREAAEAWERYVRKMAKYRRDPFTKPDTQDSEATKSAGSRYRAARDEMTDVTRRMIAPSWVDRLRPPPRKRLDPPIS